MTSYVSLLKGINVGGNKKVPMGILQQVYEDLGLQKVQTYIQSGNVVFQAENAEPNLLETQLEMAIQAKFGFQASVLVRNQTEWQEIATHHPFFDSNIPIEKFHLTLLKHLPENPPELSTILPPNILDACALHQRTIYLFCPDGYGRTQVHNTFWEKKMKQIATTRNWRTVLNLLEMMP